MLQWLHSSIQNRLKLLIRRKLQIKELNQSEFEFERLNQSNS